MSKIRPPAKTRCLSRCRALIGVFLATAFASAGAFAADWVERPYNPPIGSRWIIQRDLYAEQNDNGTISKKTFKITSELKIVGKTAEGFEVIYARRNFSYDNDDAEEQAMARPALQALQGIEYRVVTDAAGTPQRVENLADVKSAVRGMIDAIAKGNSDPQVAEAMRQTLAPMLEVDEAGAAGFYLDQLPALAAGQNTGLKLGETRRNSITRSSPLGDLVINRTLTIAEADAATGDVKIVLTESYDPDSIRAFLHQMLERLGRNGTDVSEPEKNIKDLELSLDGRTEYKVVDGMTRSLVEESTTIANLSGTRRVIKDRKVVTVTPAP